MADRSILIQGLIELHLKGEGGPQAVASMQKIIAQAKEVEKATASVGDAGKKSAEGVDALDKAFGSLGRTVAGVFAAGAIINFLKDSYIGFARTERQALAVENQIKSLGQAAQGAGFRDFIEQLSLTSGILDDDLVPAFQRALLVFEDYAVAQDILRKAAQLTAQGIGDVQSNVEGLTRFFQTGSAKSLVQFGINVKGAADGTIALAQGFELVDQKIKQGGQGFNDAQRRFELIRVAADAAGDAIGNFLDKLSTAPFSKFGITPRLGPEAVKAAFGPEDNPTIRAAQIEDANRAQADKDKKAKESSDKALDLEKDRLEKVRDLNERSEQDLLKQKIQMATDGSDQRFALEVELNRRIEAAAIASAKKIGADTASIAAFFAQDRLRILNQRATDTEANLLGPGNEAGRDRFEKEVKAFQDAEEKKTEIAQREAAERAEIAADAAKWAIQQEQQKLQTTLASAGQIAGVLSQTFAKHKAFAIAMAIANTALGITAAWSDGSLPGYWAKLAATITIAASGAAQIAAIRGASIGGGGGASPGIAAAPSSRAQNPNDSQSATVAAQSSSDIAALSGRAGRSAPGGTVINIGTAFGDRQSMTKLAREINRVNANNQGNVR